MKRLLHRQDTYKGNPWEPATQNLYVYVGNNPVNYTDPTGHRWDDSAGGGLLGLYGWASLNSTDIVQTAVDAAGCIDGDGLSCAQLIPDAVAFVAPGQQTTPRAKDLAEGRADDLRGSTGPKPTATSAVVDTTTGKVYYGDSGKPLPEAIHPELADRMPNPSKKPWDVANCAEFKACNAALLDGAQLGNLEGHTVRVKDGSPMPRCANCQITTDGMYVTSD